MTSSLRRNGGDVFFMMQAKEGLKALPYHLTVPVWRSDSTLNSPSAGEAEARAEKELSANSTVSSNSVFLFIKTTSFLVE